MPAKDFYTKDAIQHPRYHIGEHTYGKPTVFDWEDGGDLIIGRYTSIADGTTILLGGNHQTSWVSMYPFPAVPDVWPEAADIKGHPWSKGDVVIGNDVWIGNGVTILSGVTIGDGAAIAARSLVVKNVEPYTIVGGNPARPLKKRFKKKQIAALLKLQWWDWDEAEIHGALPLLCSGQIDEFIKRYQT